MASTTLAGRLGRDDLVVLTDLEEVMPLVHAAAGGRVSGCRLETRPMGWGGDCGEVKGTYGPFTHVLVCDLVSASVQPPDHRLLSLVTSAS